MVYIYIYSHMQDILFYVKGFRCFFSRLCVHSQWVICYDCIFLVYKGYVQLTEEREIKSLNALQSVCCMHWLDCLLTSSTCSVAHTLATPTQLVNIKINNFCHKKKLNFNNKEIKKFKNTKNKTIKYNTKSAIKPQWLLRLRYYIITTIIWGVVNGRGIIIKAIVVRRHLININDLIPLEGGVKESCGLIQTTSCATLTCPL